MPKQKRDEDVEAAKAAIDEVFGDTSVSKETTLERMQDILSHVENSIDCLKEDIKREQEDS